MKKILLPVLFVFILLFPLPLTAQETARESNEGTFNLLVPIAFYTSDTGFAGGGLFQRLYPSGLNFSLAGFYTQKNQVNVFYTVDYFAPDFPWWIRYDGSGRYYPESFYGIGEASDLDDEEGFYHPRTFSKPERLSQSAEPALHWSLFSLQVKRFY